MTRSFDSLIAEFLTRATLSHAEGGRGMWKGGQAGRDRVTHPLVFFRQAKE